MPEVILADSRMDTMEGYYPGRKPVGNVKIDWDHPLTEGLVFCCLCTDTSLINLVDGQGPTTVVGIGVTHITPVKGKLAYGGLPGSAAVGVIWSIPSIKDFTIAANSSFVGSALDRTLGVANAAGDNYHHYTAGTDTFRTLRTGYSATAFSIATPTLGISAAWMVSASASDGLTGYWNGEKEYTGGLWDAANDIDSVWYGLSDLTTPKTPSTTVHGAHLLCVWGRDLSEQEYHSFNTNSWQFLIPAG